VSTVHILDPGENYLTRYGGTTIVVTDMFATPVVPSPVLGTAFEARFTSTAEVGAAGPTVIEFDAILVPEPSALLALAAPFALLRRRRRA
jgi:hypothetical protein